MGRMIRYERVKRSLSQEGLAQAAKMHRNHIGAVERGETNVSLNNLLRIADALRLPLWRLMQEAEELAASEAGREG